MLNGLNTLYNTTSVIVKKGVLLLGKPNSQGDELVQGQVEIHKYLSIKEMKLIEELEQS